MNAWWLGPLAVPASIAFAIADPGERTVVTGKVVDAHGKLVAGAHVQATFDFYDPDNHDVAERFPELGLVEAGDGTFVIREGQLRPGAKALRYRTRASAPGYSASDEIISVPVAAAGGARVVLTLRPAVDHRVVVRDDLTRAPIVGALVTAACPTADLPLLVGVDGSVQLHGCDDRDHGPITVEAAGYRTGAVNVDYAKPEQTVALGKLRPLHVRAIDAASGAAVADCDLTIAGLTHRTDMHGDIDVIAAFGEVYITSKCPAYGVNLDATYRVTFAPVDVAAVHVVKLRHDTRFDGVVVDRQHQPMADATVEVRPINERSTARPMAIVTTKTTADGHFHLDGFSADTFVLNAIAGAAYASQTIVTAAVTGPITLVVAPP